MPTGFIRGHNLAVLSQSHSFVLVASALRFWRDPHSVFFNSDYVYDPLYSLARKSDADRIVSAANSTVLGNMPEPIKAGKDPIICAAFVTVTRDKIQYLDQSIGSMLEGLDEQDKSALWLDVYFVDINASKHPDWSAPWLHGLADSVGTYNITDVEMIHTKEMEKKRNFYV